MLLVFFHCNHLGLMLTAFLLMIGSSLIAGFSDLASGDLVKSDSDVSMTVSYLWMVSNCLSTAFYALIMRSKIKQVNFKVYV
jgi:GDP-mannose transporter